MNILLSHSVKDPKSHVEGKKELKVYKYVRPDLECLEKTGQGVWTWSKEEKRLKSVINNWYTKKKKKSVQWLNNFEEYQIKFFTAGLISTFNRLMCPVSPQEGEMEFKVFPNLIF